jgi:hypothetical protein
MLEKLFARNRLQKRDPEENGSWRKVAEEDYQRFMNIPVRRRRLSGNPGSKSPAEWEA